MEAIAAAKGPAVVVQREAVVVPPEPAKPALTAASEGAGLAAANGGPKKAAKGDAQSVQPILGEEIASQPTIKRAAAAPADKDVASAPKGAQREVVVAEVAKPSIAVSEAAGLAAAKGGPAMPAKATAQSARSVDREENAAQREDRSAPAAPADKEPAGGPTTSVKGNLPSAHPVAREEIAARREVINASPAPAGKQAAPSPQGPAAAAPREPVVASEPMKPSVTASSEVAGLVKPNVGPATSARSDAPTRPAERDVVVSQRRSAAPTDKEPAPSRKGPIAVAGEPVAASPEPAKPKIAAGEAAGLAGAKDGPAAPAKSEAQSTRPMERGEVAGQSEGRGASAAAAVPAPQAPVVVAQRQAAVASPEPARPNSSSTATSEAAGLAGAKAESTKPANYDAQRLHPILGEEIAAQREIKSAFAAPVDADARRGRASRGDLQEGERYVARGEESLAAGNVAVAREFFLRAADAGAARGALLLASTYDPYELVGLHVVGVQPNIDLARRWYKRAEALGEKRASERITRLERR